MKSSCLVSVFQAMQLVKAGRQTNKSRILNMVDIMKCLLSSEFTGDAMLEPHLAFALGML